MSKLGLLLACEHYPEVCENAAKIDAQLRLWLAEHDVIVHSLEVCRAYDADLPRHAVGCDAWIVSGNILADDPAGETGYALRQFLRAAVALGRPIFATHHGEHVLHAAAAGPDALPPETHEHIRSVRNPFQSFWGRDTLHRFNPATRSVEALERPASLCSRRLFGFVRRAA